MTKTELIEKVVEKTESTKKDATLIVDATFSAIQEAMAAGDKVVISGFGAFEVHDRAAREGKNPRTGEKISIPAQKSPAFKAGKALKEAVK